MSAVPKPEPKDWLTAAADELRLGDKATLALLQEAYREVNKTLKTLPTTPDAAFGNLIYRAQLERVRKQILQHQADLFDKLGDVVSARRLRSASRAAKLSAASDAALLRLVGEGAAGQRLYEGANITAQRTVETILARQGLSKVPLAERIYKTSAWMNKRLDRLITSTMAQGLNAKRFAKVARDWFSPSVPGGTRYAAMRLARTEINNAFHATSIDYARSKPWVSQMDWNLSKSHPKPDKCNIYAEESPWDVHLIPPKPHPQCMCYVTEVTPSEDDWIDRFVAGEFDDYLDEELAAADAKLGLKPKAPPTAPAPQKTSTVADVPTPIKLPTAAPTPVIPEPVKVNPIDAINEKNGYKPGQWVREVGNEREMRTIMAAIDANATPEKRAAQEAANGPDWIRKIAEQLLAPGGDDENEQVYSNGPHQVRFTGSLTRDQQDSFLGDVDFMQQHFGTENHMHINVSPRGKFDRGVGGETTLGTGYMNINEDVALQRTWPGMPISKQVSSARYVMAHEWGHSIDGPEKARETEVHNHAIEVGGLTTYGRTGADGVRAPAEGYAESFAEWALSLGKTTNKAALEYAEHFHWGERFGI